MNLGMKTFIYLFRTVYLHLIAELTRHSLNFRICHMEVSSFDQRNQLSTLWKYFLKKTILNLKGPLTFFRVNQ